ncbi:hypothetical protein CH063_01400 [Colletotrichum higginsianum]|uniref:24 kDa metalloproteinase n=2 Tax=Colletotrichum higginsianum TaxID=80884 RepID=H1V6S5_COLHI|nr:24 kDa metalloproteinase [Colletotrichum higginsianum IMI 349063]OBR04521.1 24 kDa metalloproteinase [Colletotrichum higginsianum IMI 349063]TIC89620.1 hypothetical protein CH35J_012576 [Colletotrichum higginsianum]CCF35927.1 hypothetical protein CH063_01400 [Colletotrichum higginsianum]
MLALREIMHFLLVSLVLATSPVQPSNTSTNLLPELRKRGDINRIVVVGGVTGKNSIYHCNADQVDTIQRAVQSMRRFAGLGYNFLLQDNSHTTAAYIAWFGEKHATEKWAIAIRRNIYKSIWDISDKIDNYVSGLDSIDGAVVIGCTTPEDDPECTLTESEITRALAYMEGGYIKLCTGFFSLSSDYSRAYNLWGSQRREHETTGRALLHEMTHLDGVVGKRWRTYDKAYGPDDSLLLDEDDMIENADTYKLFTLEIEANPINSKRQVKNQKDKKKIARQILQGD